MNLDRAFWIAGVLLGLFMLCGCSEAGAASITVQGAYDDIISTKYSDTWSGDIRLEQPINNVWSLGIEYAHIGESYHPNSGWLSSDGVLAEIILRPWDGILDPYALAGAGWFWHHWRNSPSEDAADIHVDLQDTWGYKAEVGVDWHLDDHWALNGFVAYFGSEYSKEEHYGNGEPSHTLGDQTLGNEGIMVGIGLGYEF